MADRIFCIDFGSAYTKVALRRDPGADSHLLVRHSSSTNEAEFCFPTAIAVDRRGAKPTPEFGDRASSMVPGGGVDVYRNWKKSIFLPATGQTSAKPHQSPLETLLQSEEMRELSSKYGVAASQLVHLQQLVGAARNMIAGPTIRLYSSEVQQQTIAATLAQHFFLWLRQQVLEACGKLTTTGLKYETIPVRLTVPAFDHLKTDESHPGWKVLLEALGKAGWPLHPESPTAAEPYANAIGVLTKGANCLQRGQVRIGEMFGRGPLITVLKDAKHHPLYHALVVDVGAFTTDFAALAMKPDGDNTSDPDSQFTVTQKSLPLGISDLDLRIVESLPAEKADWLRKARPLDWEDFRPAVYTDGKGFRRAELGIIGGPGDAEAIKSCIQEFAGKIEVELAAFLDSLGPVPDGALEELILTGGGSFIPAVREAVQSAARTGDHSYIKTHAPALKRTTGGPPVDKLAVEFARGGTALGGASIYFEKSLY